jgi:hypothetical protein
MEDVFRKQYRELNPDEKVALSDIKGQAGMLYDMLDKLNFSVPVGDATRSFTVNADPRSMALAKTKLEEAVMWATKAITG